MTKENKANKSDVTWLITGCSTGLGRHLAKEVLRSGYNAVVTARKLEDVLDITADYPDTSVPLALDIANKTQVEQVIKQAEQRFGQIHVLINNAGYGFRGAVEEADDEEMRKIFDTNFFGTVNMIQGVLPGMRAHQTGTIMSVSSIGGRFAAAGSGYYSATKFAIEGMSDALRKELKPLGIRVVVIEPGAFRTDFAGRSLTQSKQVIADYTDTAGQRRKEKDQTNGKQQGDPVKAAAAIIQVYENNEVPFRLLLGSDAIKLVQEELELQAKEIKQWQHISMNTDFDG
jgi:NAD(P)-dependent dehydrogenase (short-subunit alcohol dehydrogenase family)